MANMEDYLKWRGDITFKQSPFNEVDNLILSELAYIEIRNRKLITVKEAILNYLEKYSDKEIIQKFSLSESPIVFLKLLSKTKRFGNLKITNYVNYVSVKEEKQFSAMIIYLCFNTAYIAFKGTDETLVGWKEDLNLGFMDEIPSQKEAVCYVNQFVPFYVRHIYMGGHSKGGNLAVYAGVKCRKSIKKRIKLIFNNDGPGFTNDFISDLSYIKLLPKIRLLIPETSIIGMLFAHKSNYQVIKSNSTGIWQHDALSWQVEGTKFIHLKETDETSNKINAMLSSWIQNLDKKKREVFINTLYQFFLKCQIETVQELANFRLRNIPSFVKSFTQLDMETRKIMIETIHALIKEANKNFERKTILTSLKILGKKHS